MKNEQAKREAIKKAFGKSWDMLTYSMQQHILNVHHWVDRSHNRMNKSPNDLNFDVSECEINCEFWRPIQLMGIEDNNGWIRIEPDGSNLPGNMSTSRFKIYYDLIDNQYHESFDALGVRNMFRQHSCSHYKPIQPELKPVY